MRTFITVVIAFAAFLSTGGNAFACLSGGPSLYDTVVQHVRLNKNTPKVFYVRFGGTLADLNAAAGGATVHSNSGQVDQAFPSLQAAQAGQRPSFVLAFDKESRSFANAYNGVTGKKLDFFQAKGGCGVSFTE